MPVVRSDGNRGVGGSRVAGGSRGSDGNRGVGASRVRVERYRPPRDTVLKTVSRGARLTGSFCRVIEFMPQFLGFRKFLRVSLCWASPESKIRNANSQRASILTNLGETSYMYLEYRVRLYCTLASSTGRAVLASSGAGTVQPYRMIPTHHITRIT